MRPAWSQAGGKVLVDERSLWPGRKFAITVLAVRTDFLKEHPDTVKALLAGDLDAADFIAKDPAKSQKDVGDVIAKVVRQAAEGGRHRRRVEER